MFKLFITGCLLFIGSSSLSAKIIGLINKTEQPVKFCLLTTASKYGNTISCGEWKTIEPRADRRIMIQNDFFGFQYQEEGNNRIDEHKIDKIKNNKSSYYYKLIYGKHGNIEIEKRRGSYH